ncbi:YbaB/EbfC family nucleoid-associated protein [Streptococcaceae bacterium ESL0729]|nr:YbaB/EbfC family nucleoid-associated protein [Streptococcaceae bacterium ESL0729]
MMNMQKMMKEAQKLQKQMQVSQEELAKTTFTGSSAQELVVVEFTGDKVLKNIAIKEELVDPEDVDTLEAMIADAINKALTEVDKATESKMGKFAKNLPF